MSEHFPDQISPLQFARSGKSLQHQFPIGQFERACSLLVSERGELDITLQFGRDHAGISTLQGRLEAVVQLGCQRCMEPMDITIESAFSMALIEDESEEEQIPESYEALLDDDKSFSLLNFIEDELILAIPVVASHAADQCSATQFLQDSVELEIAPEKRNPFQILKQLRQEP